LKILIVSPISIFPNTRGSTNRILELAKSLVKAGAEVFILHAGHSGTIKEGISFFGYLSFADLLGTKNVIGRFLDRNIGSFNIFSTRHMYSIVNKVQPDIIQFEFPTIFGSPFNIWSKIPNAVKVLDEHNVELLTAKSSSSVPYISPIKTGIEKRAVETADLVLSVSEADKTTLIQLYSIPENRVIVIPNGVNFKKYSSINKYAARKKLGIEESAKIMFFHGTMSWRPNREAVDMITSFICPRVKSHCSEATFFIAGEDSETLYGHYSELDNGICILGFVDNLVDYIMASDICIVPLISGGGTSLKMLEYMAAGKPIVTTKVGSRGLPIVDGEHAIIRNELKNDFPEAIIKILEIPEEEWIGNQARNLAFKYDWENMGQKLYSIYSRILIE